MHGIMTIKLWLIGSSPRLKVAMLHMVELPFPRLRMIQTLPNTARTRLMGVFAFPADFLGTSHSIKSV